MRRLPLVAVFVLLAAAACSSGGAADVRPFEEIQAGEVAFENDPTFPGRGIFRVTTTEPAICAIVWGETEELGKFNNSLDMNGTGIVQHDVFLPGAEPGVTYFYRLQGSTADGTLYQSELMTFRLPAVDIDENRADRGPNLALGAEVIAVSSEFSAAWSGANAVDGDLNTEWSSAGDGNEGFITIDLGTPRQVAGVEFLTRTMTDGSATTSTFTITVDGGDPLGPFGAGNPADPNYQDVAFTGQVVRFDIAASTGGNTGAIEIRLFGSDG